MRTFTPAALRGFSIGVLLVVISLPLLFGLHGILGLGSPPVSGLILLGLTVALTLALAGVVGAMMGQAKSNPLLAGLVGLGLGIVSCGIAAPLYGGIVVDSLTQEATNMVWSERDKITGAAQSTARGTFDAAREGRLRDELARLQQQAQNATSPQARQNALGKAKQVAADLRLVDKGVSLAKSGAERLSAFGLLFWALLAPPLGAAWECRRAKRR